MNEIEYSRIFCYFDTMYNGKANKMSCLSTVSMEIPTKVHATQCFGNSCTLHTSGICLLDLNSSSWCYESTKLIKEFKLQPLLNESR